MKSKLLNLIFFIFLFYVQAQTFSKSIPNDIVKDQAVSLVSGKEHPLTKSYFIRVKKDGNSNYLSIDLIAEDPDNVADATKKESFKIYPLTLDEFANRFKRAFRDLVGKAETVTVNPTTKFSDLELSLLFVQLIAFERTENERPVVANITLKKNIPVMMQFKDLPSFKTYKKTKIIKCYTSWSRTHRRRGKGKRKSSKTNRG